jgi:hypothetical protein
MNYFLELVGIIRGSGYGMRSASENKKKKNDGVKVCTGDESDCHFLRFPYSVLSVSLHVCHRERLSLSVSFFVCLFLLYLHFVTVKFGSCSIHFLSLPALESHYVGQVAAAVVMILILIGRL